MKPVFETLTQEENDDLIDVIALITLLIGTADGQMQQKEKSWAQRVAKFRTHGYNKDLTTYYEAVSSTFDERLNHFMREVPHAVEDSRQYLTQQLSARDSILHKLDAVDGYALYHDYLSFAKHVAKSAGGFFYMANVSPAEKALLGLDMLTPIDSYSGI